MGPTREKLEVVVPSHAVTTGPDTPLLLNHLNYNNPLPPVIMNIIKISPPPISSPSQRVYLTCLFVDLFLK